MPFETAIVFGKLEKTYLLPREKILSSRRVKIALLAVFI